MQQGGKTAGQRAQPCGFSLVIADMSAELHGGVGDVVGCCRCPTATAAWSCTQLLCLHPGRFKSQRRRIQQSCSWGTRSRSRRLHLTAPSVSTAQVVLAPFRRAATIAQATLHPKGQLTSATSHVPFAARHTKVVSICTRTSAVYRMGKTRQPSLAHMAYKAASCPSHCPPLIPTASTAIRLSGGGIPAGRHR